MDGGLSSEATRDTTRDGAKKHGTMNRNAVAKVVHGTALLFKMRERDSSKGRHVSQTPNHRLELLEPGSGQSVKKL